jgi:hypothetical protein
MKGFRAAMVIDRASPARTNKSAREFLHERFEAWL